MPGSLSLLVAKVLAEFNANTGLGGGQDSLGTLEINTHAVSSSYEKHILHSIPLYCCCPGMEKCIGPFEWYIGVL